MFCLIQTGLHIYAYVCLRVVVLNIMLRFILMASRREKNFYCSFTPVSGLDRLGVFRRIPKSWVSSSNEDPIH